MMVEMDDVDASTYLTQRLRTLQPDSYERELERNKKQARLVGIAVGSVGSLLAVFALVLAVVHFMPEFADELLASLL
jgi:hypothetical protein